MLYREQTTKRGQYNGGINCNLNNAQVARDGKIENPIHCTAFNDFAIAGDVTKIKLSGDARIEYRFARSHDKEKMSGEKTDAMFDKINKSIKSTISFEVINPVNAACNVYPKLKIPPLESMKKPIISEKIPTTAPYIGP